MDNDVQISHWQYLQSHAFVADQCPEKRIPKNKMK